MTSYYEQNKHKWKVYRANKLKNSEQSKKSYYNCKEKRKQNNIDWAASNYEKHLFTQAKGRARRSKLEFSITLDDIVIPEYCPYLDIKLTKLWGFGRQDTNASIDRIDNTKGYVKGNIEIISFKANLLKRDATIKELITFSKNVIKRFNNNANC